MSNLNPKLDSSRRVSSQNSSLCRKINSIMHKSGIVDVWRQFHPKTKDQTFYTTPHSTHSQTDYFLMFKKDMFLIKTCSIGVMDVSDHCPVQMEMDFNFKRKTAHQRQNTSILNGQTKEEMRQKNICAKMITERFLPPFHGMTVKQCYKGK